MGEPWSIAGLLSRMAARGAHAAVVSVRGTTTATLTHGEVASLARRLADGLRADGLADGEHVALWGPNTPDWIIAALAVNAAGGVIVPIDDQAADAEAAAQISDSGARRAFVATAHLPAFADGAAGSGPALLRLDGGETGEPPHWRTRLAAASAPAEPHRPADPSRPLALLYTSGTTGTPKAFYLTQGNIAANVEALRASDTVHARDRLLLPLPLHHAYPWVVGTLTALDIGVAIVLPEGVSGPQLGAALKAGDVSVLIGVPRLYEALADGIAARADARGHLTALAFRTLLALSKLALRRFDRNPGRLLLAPVRRQVGPKLRLLVSGGARLDGEVIWRLRAMGWNVLSGYGLAETASIFTANLPQARRVGSEGRPIGTGSRIRIAGADEMGVGEIELRGPSVFGGYRNNPEANAAAFTSDGWFRTGDLGRLDDDGFVTVTGRVKEVIVLAGGKNVSPEDVEADYARHPFISEVAILERAGQLVGLVRPDLDAVRAGGSIQPREAIRVALTTVGQQLPTFKRLSGFALVREPLPRTRLGKHRRFLLPALYERARTGERGAAAPLSDDDRAWLATSPRQEIWALLAARYPHRQLALSTSPQLDLGFDSFEWMSLAVAMDERFGVRLSEDDIAASDTLKALIRRAEARLSTGTAAPAPLIAAAAGTEPDWLAPPGLILAAAGRAICALNRVLIRTVFGLRIEGLERLPRRGPLIIVPNHVSDLDPAVLAAALPAELRPQVCWAAEKTRLFGGPLQRLFCRAMRIFPADEGRPAAVLATARRALEGGAIPVWFAEGWRSPDGRLQRFLPGIGRIVLDTGVPVVPVLLLGTFEALPRHRRWPRRVPLRVVFGAPITAAALRTTVSAAAPEATPEAVAAALREALLALARSHGTTGVLPIPLPEGCGEDSRPDATA